jgi:hypothetical protein
MPIAVCQTLRPPVNPERLQPNDPNDSNDPNDKGANTPTDR